MAATGTPVANYNYDSGWQPAPLGFLGFLSIGGCYPDPSGSEVRARAKIRPSFIVNFGVYLESNCASDEPG